MAKLPPISINISDEYGFTKSQLESLKKAFNVQLASIEAARKGESDSPVGETNVSKQPTTQKKSKKRATAKSSAKKR